MSQKTENWQISPLPPLPINFPIGRPQEGIEILTVEVTADMSYMEYMKELHTETHVRGICDPVIDMVLDIFPEPVFLLFRNFHAKDGRNFLQIIFIERLKNV